MFLTCHVCGDVCKSPSAQRRGVHPICAIRTARSAQDRPFYRLMVRTRSGAIRRVVRGSLIYLARIGHQGRRRRDTILGHCWIELSSEPAVAVTKGLS